MLSYLQYLKDHLPFCRNGIVKTVEAKEEGMERCIVEFVQWKNHSTISCSARLENDWPGNALLRSGNEIPVTLKFINRKKNLYMMIKGKLTMNKSVSRGTQDMAMADILIENADFFTMKHYGSSIRLLERKTA
jgi:hypothetical protein